MIDDHSDEEFSYKCPRKMFKIYRGQKRLFEKHKQRLDEIGKEIYSFFQHDSFGQQEGKNEKAHKKQDILRNTSPFYDRRRDTTSCIGDLVVGCTKKKVLGSSKEDSKFSKI